MNKLSHHIFIDGRVQGICYRSFAKTKARQFHITGWIKNLSDGRVEIMACGNEQELETFKKWLWRGPFGAKVINITCDPVPFEDHNNFKIIY